MGDSNMIRSVNRALTERHGNVVELDATPATGLAIDDTVYHLAHDYPGGVPALALRMGMSPNTLAHKVSLTQRTHHLSPLELIKLQAIADDQRPLHAMAAQLGFVCLPLVADASRGTLEDVMHMAKEFADVLASVNQAVTDGRVTPNEMQRCEREAGELMLALTNVLATVRSMMPPAPEAAA